MESTVNVLRRNTLEWYSRNSSLEIKMSEDKKTLYYISGPSYDVIQDFFLDWLCNHTQWYNRNRKVIVNTVGLPLMLRRRLKQLGVKLVKETDMICLNYYDRDYLIREFSKFNIEHQHTFRYHERSIDDDYVTYYITLPADIEYVIYLSDLYGDDIMKTMSKVYSERDMWFTQPVIALQNKHTGKIEGYHAVSINNPKYPGIIKSYYILLAPEARGKGLAKKLFTSCMQYCVMSGYTTFMARTSTNGGGRAFYASMGMTEYYEGKNEFGTEDFYFKDNLLLLPKFKGELI